MRGIRKTQAPCRYKCDACSEVAFKDYYKSRFAHKCSKTGERTYMVYFPDREKQLKAVSDMLTAIQKKYTQAIILLKP